MKILLVGKGWVGTKMFAELLNRNHEVKIVSHGDAIEEVNQSEGLDWVINCAGVTGVPNVDACELDKVGTIQGNTVFPIVLYHTTQNKNIRFAHFSSGCIYEGNIETTDAKPNFFGSIYSISKGASDSYLLDKAVIFRIRMAFNDTTENKNFLTKVYKYAKTAKLIEGGNNSITNLDEAVTVACNVIERNESNGGYNLVNKGSVTMHDVVELMGITPEWFTPEEFSIATAARRSNCVIPAYHEMTDIKTALKNVINVFNENIKKLNY